MRTRRAVLGTVIAALLPAAAHAALTGTVYTSYRDLHEKSSYGALFFNQGAIRTDQNGWRKNFHEIGGDGDLALPRQSGYCFVFNHFNGEGHSAGNQTYSAEITKLKTDGTSSVENFKSTFDPAATATSSDMPNLCVTGLQNVKQVEIKFSSSDETYFDWKISFNLA